MLAVAGAALAGLAIFVPDDPDWRLALGSFGLGCAVAGACIWIRRWWLGGNRPRVIVEVWKWLGGHKSTVVLVVALCMSAIGAARGWRVEVMAQLLAVGAAAVNVRLRHPRRTVVAGFVGALLFVLLVDDGGTAALVVAGVVCLAYFVVLAIGHLETEPAEITGVTGRFGRLLLRVLGSALLLATGIVGAAFVAGRFFLDNAALVPFGAVRVAALLLAAIVVAVVAWWWRSYEEIVLERETPSYLTGILLGLVAVGLLLGVLDEPRDPTKRPEQEVLATEAAAHGRFDLILVVDPADPVGRALIRRAREDLLAHPSGVAAGAMFAPRVPDSPYDIAYGLAVPEPHGGKRLWRLVEPPTTDVREIGRALAAVRPRDGDPATGSYGRILFDLSSEFRVDWREHARRGVAFLLDELPDGDEFAVPSGAGAGLCRTLEEKRPRVPGEITESTVTVWSRAVTDQCSQRRTFRSWHRTGRSREGRVFGAPVALHVVTRDDDPRRLAAWRTWSKILGGKLDASGAGRRLDGDAAFHLVQDAADMHTGVPVGELKWAAWEHRPILKFDPGDDLRPVDVDWLLGPDRRPPPLVVTLCETAPGEDEPSATERCATAKDNHQDVQRVCDRSGRDESCDDIRSAADLAGHRDELIDFEGDGAPPSDADDPPRMYVDVWERDRQVFLGYWWFFRYNTSPWRREVNCVPGITFGGVSCHDHEGDWEGVTVVLERRQGALVPVGATYDAHGREVRWNWEDLETEDGRPKVYVAVGSHASYPAACKREECDQRLSGKALGDGGFDGTEDWELNGDDACWTLGQDYEELRRQNKSPQTHGPCLVALPAVYDPLLDDPETAPTRLDEGRRGVLWNAFPGKWGKARCTAIGRVCVQVDGPDSPARQGRFVDPAAHSIDDDPEPECGDREVLYQLRGQPMPPQRGTGC